MKHFRPIIFLLAMVLAAGSSMAQGLGFYLGGKRVELTEGDSIQFTDNVQGEVEVKVTKDGNVEVYQGQEMTFFGDIERYFLDVNNAMHYFDQGTGQHYSFGYGGIMHMRDVLTADLFRTANNYNWFASWSENKYVGPAYSRTKATWQFYENALTAINKLIGAIDEDKANDRQREYLGVAYAFRAMHYLDMARMYEYLPCTATKPYSYTGRRLTNLTVPIITEKTTPGQLTQLTRATREEMRAFIGSDLDKAATLLSHYQRTSKLLPDLACVYGLQARLSMWVEDYDQAARLARKAITQSGATPLTEAEMLDVENGFNATAPSAWMWGTQPREDDAVVLSGIINWPSWMSNEATYGYAHAGTYPCITPSLYQSMGGDDMRRKLFRVSDDYSEPHLASTSMSDLPKYASLKFRPYKGHADDYAVGSQSAYPLMRVEEMYFIEAEAKAHSSVTEGVALLNDFMDKYRQPGYSFPTAGAQEQEAIQEIVRQKRIELWGEGQSFFDYKRLDMSVDRTQGEDTQYIPQSEQLSNAGCGRPAWMNLAFPIRNLMQYKWNSIGQENPDPSGLYYVGGGGMREEDARYDVTFSDGIVRELFGITTPAEYVTVKACPMDSAEGLVLQEPFAQIADSTMGYDGTALSIRLSGTAAHIPAQPLGFSIDGNQVMVESTQDGSYANGIVSFPRNGITLTYGNEVKVVNSGTLTEVRLPGSPIPGFSVSTSFYADTQHHSTVVTENGRQYLHTYIIYMSDLDEVRLACVAPAQASEALDRLKADAGYGVVARDTGMVSIPMADVQGEFVVVGIGLRNGSIACTRTGNAIKYPDYTGLVTNGKAAQDGDGNWEVQAMYYFAPQVEAGYVALVEKYATVEDVRTMYEAGLLPSCVQVPLNHTAQMQKVSVPYPKWYAEYKLATLSVIGRKVVDVDFWSQDGRRPETYECPARELSVSLTGTSSGTDGSGTWEIQYDASAFNGAYIALLPDSMLAGNVWDHVLTASHKTRVTGKGTTTISIPGAQPSDYYTVVIAGCDASGRIQKDVAGQRHCAYDPYTRWYSTRAEWVADGHDASAWPLAADASTCSYTHKNISTQTFTGLPISYRYSATDRRGQFRISGWWGDSSLTIDYDPTTSNCQVLPQYVTTTSKYGVVSVADLPHYQDGLTYAQYPCTYDRLQGTFDLTLIYYVNGGSFGYEMETAQVDGFGSDIKGEAQTKREVKAHLQPSPTLTASPSLPGLHRQVTDHLLLQATQE